MLRYAMVFLFLCFISITGCATMMVDELDHPMPSLYNEYWLNNKGLDGVYTGIEEIQNQPYARFQLNITPDCEEPPKIDLLLPLDKYSNNKALLRFGRNSDKLSSLNKSVQIVVYSTSIHSKKDMDVNSLLPPDSWQGYPSKIIVKLFSNKENPDSIILAYRSGPTSEDIQLRIANGERSHWRCDNRGSHTFAAILKPFAVVFDFVTFPFQALLMAIAY
jgi:hypothetical protein